MAKRIQVGGRIESKEVGGIVTGAAEILDDAKGKKQSVINQETDTELERLDQSKQDNLTFDNAPTEGSDNPVKSGGVYAADKALSDAIEAILLLIPSAASALNKLVDTAMMNSSISTATATFRGTYNVVTDLSLTVDATHEQIAESLGNVISTADNNDYTFVQVPVSTESTDIRRTERYKFNGTAWGYEYDLNTSGFTAAQWAAINSGITIALVGKLIGLPTSSELQALLGQKQDTLTFDNIPVSGSANPVKSGGVYSAINDEKTAREQLAQTVTGIDGRVGNVEEVIPTGAAANNKLVANNSMEAYVTSIIDAITASFTIATADGHINLALTQTNGRVASLTLTSSDIASAQALTALTGRVSTAESNITTLGGRVSTAEDNITTLGGRVSTNETDIANLQQLYNNLQQSKPVPVTALPETGQQQGVIYRLAGTTSYSDYMWNGSTWVLMATYNNAIDPRPKKASQNLVTSGGVFDNIGALDVSELNATENPHTLAQYVDLSAALAAIPTDYQKGGMSIKFVQSSDNKYVQYRYMESDATTDNKFTNVNNWSFCGNDVYVENPEYVYVITDREGKVLFGIGKNGEVEFDEGLPRPIKEALLTKVNKIDGKKLIDSVYSDAISSSENIEFLQVEIDSDGKLLSATREDGTHYISFIESETIDELKNVLYDETSIFHHNNDSLYRNLFIQSCRRASVGTTFYNKPLVLVHFSDIHGYTDNLSRLVSFCDRYRIYINDILHTGDTVFNTWGNDFGFWNAVPGTEKILNCIGNHDVSVEGGVISPEITPSMAYDRYFKPYIDNWNVNSAGEGLCYYYKDYTEENVRLIVLDNCKWDDDELTWFEDTLSSAGDLHVVCAGHFPCGALSPLNCTFETLNVKTNIAGMPNAAMIAVQSFIEGGGTFICWLVGHTHMDYMGTLVDYPQQFMIAVANAGLNSVWDDTTRVEGAKSQDSFNVVAFDTHDKLIKGFKVGADYDRFLRHRGTFCYNYDTKQLIYNN